MFFFIQQQNLEKNFVLSSRVRANVLSVIVAAGRVRANGGCVRTNGGCVRTNGGCEGGKMPLFCLPDFFDCPEPLTTVLRAVWERKYLDLYEAGGTCDLEAAFAEVMQCVGNPLVSALEHKRYVYTAWAMAIAARPTLEHYYYPQDARVSAAFEYVSAWVQEGEKVLSDFPQVLFPDIDQRGPYQAADEAYNVVFELLRCLDPETASESILNLLYDAIASDAISGFARAKRDMFNWWVVEVVPSGKYSRHTPSAAAFCLLGLCNK
jgi:hypothetical protein